MMLKLNNFLYYNITRKYYKNRIAKFLIFLALHQYINVYFNIIVNGQHW